MWSALLLLSLVSVTIGQGQNQTFVMYSMNWAVGPACLDGTPPAYYLQTGSGTGVNKWYIHHQGGGWCESLDDCYERSFGDLGSSAKYPPTKTMEGPTYFSTDPKYNPMMWNWNKIYIPYCDGGSMSGNNDTVTTYKGKKLYFRGKQNLNSVISYLIGNSPLLQATDVVISGCSAGGLATYLHVDRWAGVLTGAKVVGLPDSGFFLDYQDKSTNKDVTVPSDFFPGETTIPGNYHDGLVWVYNQMNCSSGVNTACVDHYRPTGNDYNCMFAQHTAPFIKTPMFALQSQYDAWQTGHEIAQQPPTTAEINAYGAMFRKIFNANFLSNPKNSALLDACHHHCGKWTKVHTNGESQATAFQKWYEAEPGSSPRFIQNASYPCTSCCN